MSICGEEGKQGVRPYRKVSKNLVRAIALLSFSPEGQAATMGEIENVVTVENFALYDYVPRFFMVVYTLAIFFAGFAVGLYLRKVCYETRVAQVVNWVAQAIHQSCRKGSAARCCHWCRRRR